MDKDRKSSKILNARIDNKGKPTWKGPPHFSPKSLAQVRQQPHSSNVYMPEGQHTGVWGFRHWRNGVLGFRHWRNAIVK